MKLFTVAAGFSLRCFDSFVAEGFSLSSFLFCLIFTIGVQAQTNKPVIFAADSSPSPNVAGYALSEIVAGTNVLVLTVGTNQAAWTNKFTGQSGTGIIFVFTNADFTLSRTFVSQAFDTNGIFSVNSPAITGQRPLPPPNFRATSGP